MKKNLSLLSLISSLLLCFVGSVQAHYDSMACSYTGHHCSHDHDAHRLSLQEITDFIHENEQSPIHAIASTLLLNQLDEHGIESKLDGLFYSKTYQDRRGGCKLDSFELEASMKVHLNNNTNVEFSHENILDPIYLELALDGSANISAHFDADPGTTPHPWPLDDKCESLGDADANLDLDLSFRTLTTLMIDYDIKFTPEELSYSRSPEILITPSGFINSRITSFHLNNQLNIDIDADTEVPVIISAIVNAVSFPLTGILIDPIMAIEGFGYLEDKVEDQFENSWYKMSNDFIQPILAQYGGSGHTEDISSKLGQSIRFILPTESELTDDLLRDILQHEKAMAFLCSNQSSRSEALASLISNDGIFKSLENACGTAVLVSIYSAL